jgi:hypothetical protein
MIDECSQVTDGRPCLQEGKKYAGLIGKQSFSQKKFVKPDPVPKRIETKCPIPGMVIQVWEVTGSSLHTISRELNLVYPSDLSCLLTRMSLILVISILNEASYACGLGGFRSRGYGLVDISVDFADFSQ